MTDHLLDPAGERCVNTIAVVLNYRRAAMTTACVESLERSTSPVDVLIVDNDSADGSAELLRARFPQHQHLDTGANLGYAGGNNRGIEWALARGYERLLIINDDAEVKPDMLAQLHAALDADPLAAMAAPSILHEHPPEIVWWAGGRFTRLRGGGVHEGAGRPLAAELKGAAPRPVTFVTGCCFLVRVEVLRTLGAFREDFGAYVEDVELSLRYLNAGQRLLHVPSAFAVHKVPFPEPEAAAWKIQNRDRNRRRLVRTHYGIGDKLLFYPVFAVTRLGRLLQYLLRGDWARARAIVEGAILR